jgi:hypothetical protein
MHFDSFQEDVDGWGSAKVEGVGVGYIFDFPDFADKLSYPFRGDWVSDDKQEIDLWVSFEAQVFFVSQRHQVIGVSVFSGVEIEKGVRPSLVQQDIVKPNEVEVEFFV